MDRQGATLKAAQLEKALAMQAGPFQYNTLLDTIFVVCYNNNMNTNKLWKTLLLLFNIKRLPIEILIAQILRKGSLVLPGGKVMQLFLGYVLLRFIKKILYRFKINPNDNFFDVTKNQYVTLKPKFEKLYSKYFH